MERKKNRKSIFVSNHRSLLTLSRNQLSRDECHVITLDEEKAASSHLHCCPGLVAQWQRWQGKMAVSSCLEINIRVTFMIAQFSDKRWHVLLNRKNVRESKTQCWHVAFGSIRHVIALFDDGTHPKLKKRVVLLLKNNFLLAKTKQAISGTGIST